MGRNDNGQLGRGYQTTDANGVSATDTSRDPVQVYAPAASQPVDSRDLITLSGVVHAAPGESHNVFYMGDGSVFDVGLGTSGQLGNAANVTENLPVRVGDGNNNAAKPSFLEILENTKVVAAYDYDVKTGEGNMPPDFITVRLNQQVSIDPSRICLQYTDGFYHYRDGQSIEVPAGAEITFRSGDDSIGMFLDDSGNKVASVTRTADSTQRVVLVSADGVKTGMVTIYTTVRVGGVETTGQLRVAFAEPTATREAGMMVSAGVDHSAAVAEDGTL